ncbi:MAG: hypothetical protein WC100_09325 [Sterolibacterium sp.]
MNKLNINLIALAVSLAFSTGVMAQNMSKNDYRAGKDSISAEYKTAKAACGSLSGNAHDVCKAEAKGKESVALAELEASYKPSSKTHYEARVAKAEALYEVAKEHCDDQAGNAKDVCVKEAKAAKTTGKAEAKAQMKITNANATANEKSTEARNTASDKRIEARKDAASDTLDAQYGVAKEKCDTFAGSAKDNCLNQAKVSFGKS